MAEETFEDYLTEWDIPYFSASELLTLGSGHYIRTNKGYGLNSLPPRQLWSNIIPTAKIASLAREEVGPIKVTSAYRSKAYNAALGSKETSLHRKFNALDLIPMEASPEELHELLIDMRNDGWFLGGVGIYHTFVHLDTRGYNADWDMRR